MARPRLRSLVYYDHHFQMIACYPNRSNEEPYHYIKKEYFYVAPDQARLLSYAQAVDFEDKLAYASNEKQAQQEKRKQELQKQGAK